MASKSFQSEAQRIFRNNPDCSWLTVLSGQSQVVYALRDLEKRINDYCSFYQVHNIHEGDTVVIILQESLDLFASFFAAIIYGAFPAYYAYPSPKQSVERFGESIENLVKYNSVRLVIGFDAIKDVLGNLNLSTANELDVVLNGTVPQSNDVCFNNVLPTKHEAFLQFSSGTTGSKKGVVISMKSLFNQIEAYKLRVQFDQKSRVITWLPHYHDMGLIACMFMPFLLQVPVIMMSPFEWVKNPRKLLDAITQHQGSHIWLPNFALGHMVKSVRSEELDDINLQTLKKIILCSEPVLPGVVDSFVNKFKQCGLDVACLENCYAMAENTFAMSSTCGGGLFYLEVDEELLRKKHHIQEKRGGLSLASSGKPLDNVSLMIVDESGNSLSEDKVGEVWMQSDCMLSEYRHNSDVTQQSFSDEWFKTGDLGFFHDDQLFITGRKNDLIIVGGENIYPQDIEGILNEVPSLIPGRNVAFGIPDERVGTEKIIIVAEVKNEYDAPDRNHLQTKVTNVLNVGIAEIVFLPHRTLLKGTAGKISRHLNRQAYLNGGFCKQVIKSENPVCRIDDVVRHLIPSAMKDQIRDDTLLLSSGLIDSFGFADLVQRLEASFGVTIPEELWQEKNFQTIATIQRTLNTLGQGRMCSSSQVFQQEYFVNDRKESLRRLKQGTLVDQGYGSWKEWCINHFPFQGSVWYRWLFRLAGIQLGHNVKFLGKVKVKLRGVPQNIRIDDNVILGDGVDLRNRENGKIHLKERVYLDQNVRVIAARDGLVEVGFGSEVGLHTTINSGGTTRIGEFCMIAGGVNINSSCHGTHAAAYVKSQPHLHGVVELGDDVWVGSGASILVNTKIGNGAILSSNSLVTGEIPDFAVCAGVPAKIIRYR